MPRKIKTNSITDPNIQQPFTGPSLAFLQQWNEDSNFAIIRALIGDSNYGVGPFALYGLADTGTNPVVNIAAGFMLYDGELFECTGLSTTLTGSNVVVCTITEAFDLSIDPVLFTDLVPRNVHSIRTVVLSQALTGTADFDFSTITYVQPTIKTITVDIGDWNMDASNTKSVATGIASNKIRSVTGFVRDDADALYYPIGYSDGTGTLELWGGAHASGSVTLIRLTGGMFDNANYNATSFNRGWLTITYEL